MLCLEKSFAVLCSLQVPFPLEVIFNQVEVPQGTHSDMAVLEGLHGTRIRPVYESNLSKLLGRSIATHGFHPSNTIIIAIHVAVPEDDDANELMLSVTAANRSKVCTSLPHGQLPTLHATWHAKCFLLVSI